MPQIIRVVVFPYNQYFLNNSLLLMYNNAHQKESEFFGEKDLFSSQKLKRGMINNPYDFVNQSLDVNFEDIFCGKFAPNISTLSVSTRSNVSYDNYDMSSDFFIDGCLQQELKQYYKPNLNEVCPQIGMDMSTKLAASAEQNKDVMGAQGSKIAVKKIQSDESSHDQTKNIPKNYIKAIFAFILQNTEYLHRLFKTISNTQDTISEVANFIDYVRNQKKIKKYTIQRLKTLWLDERNGKVMRIISNQFLRKRSLGYISGSKIEKKMQHVRYRHRFIKAIENPNQFTNIK